MFVEIISGIGIAVIILLGFFGVFIRHDPEDAKTPRTHLFEDEEGNRENPFSDITEGAEDAENSEYKYDDLDRFD